MADKKLYIGLDVGSDSVGWAATDQDFKLRRIKGKTAWGARLFDKASDAKTRRMKRSARRRSARRKYRIFLLNQLFAEALEKKDPNFLIRLANSNLHLEDKAESIKTKTPVFPTREEEISFYQQYPTIWHLRKAMLDPSCPAYDDVRLVYLAIHHIIKYRGNFLKMGTFEVNKFDDEIIYDLNAALNSVYERVASLDESETEQITFFEISNKNAMIKILEDRDLNVRLRKKKLIELFDNPGNPDFTPYLDLFAALVSGGKYDLAKLDDEHESLSFCFDNHFEDNESAVAASMGDDFKIVLCAKRVFDYIQLKDLLRGKASLSEAFVSIYECHKEALAYLKKICKEIDKRHGLVGEDSLFFKIFKSKENENNYASFVHVDSLKKRADIHSFNLFVVKSLEPYCGEYEKDANFRKIIFLAENDQLLLSISNVSTSIIPHQLHQLELDKILENAAKRHPFIEKISAKIKELFLFRVPYYFGPLNDRSRYSYVSRRQNVTITPWNIDEVIDRSKTREKFINSLVSTCSYLIGDTSVLPLDSIVYQKYVILNRLNGIRINGQLVLQEVKSALYQFILRRKKTTTEQVKRFLERNFDIYRKDHASISGLNETDPFISDSYHLFMQFYNTDELNGQQLTQAEEIVRLLALYADCPNDALDYIDELIVPLNKEGRSILKTKQFKGWGKLSKTLLVDMKACDDFGVYRSIIETLEENVLTFNAIINDKTLGFGEEIERRNRELIGEKTPDEVVNEIIDELPPDRRRSTIQAVRIVDEIVALAKQKPDYISIEVTRQDEKNKKQKDSRYNELMGFLGSLQKDKDSFIAEQAKHSKACLEEEFSDDQRKLKLKGTALYLYFKQAGIDLYTGRPIDIMDVLNSDKYDIDHIVPQSLMKDDSLDNKVLVERYYNQNVKKSIYPVPEQIRCNPAVLQIWKILHSHKMISDKKYNSFIRSSEITEEELNGFVNAQINIVNASNISIKKILKLKYPETTLIFSKAAYPSEIRREYEIPKMRELNDTHHAVDAYLNVVAGVTLYKEYSLDYVLGRNPGKQEIDKTYNMSKRMLDLLLHRHQKETVIAACKRHDFLLTYRYSYNDNAFYNETINKKGNNDSLIPIHTKGPMSDTRKYGGYSGLSGCYFVVAEIQGKDKRRVLVDIKTLWDKLYDNDEMLAAIKDRLNLKKGETFTVNFDKKILLGQKVFIDGCTYLLKNSNEQLVSLYPVSPLFLDELTAKYLSFAFKHIDDLKGIAGEYTFVLDKKEQHTISISTERNLEIVRSIIDLSRHPKYKSYTLVNKLESEVELDGFAQKTLDRQVAFIISLLRYFNRNVGLIKAPMRKTKTGFLSLKPVAIYESITGLLSFKKEL